MTESVNTELRIAVIGAGPAGVYSSDIFLRQLKKLGEELGLGTEARIDLFEKLPVPFGLVRYGVAPDHPSIKFIASALEKTLDNPNIHLYCDVEFGKDVTLDDLLARYDAVLFATGAVEDKPLGLPGADLDGVYGAAKFVEWYDGYPTGAREWPLDAENVAVIGGGNVAMDVARELMRNADDLKAKTDIPDNVYEGIKANKAKTLHLFIRRGVAQAKFSVQELREMEKLPGVQLIINENDFDLDDETIEVAGQNKLTRQMVEELFAIREMAEDMEDDGDVDYEGNPADRKYYVHFNSAPTEILGEDGKVKAIRVERTETGQRIYEDCHIDRLCAICCFKNAGMTIDDLKKFFVYESNEPEHIDEILDLLESRRESLDEQRRALNEAAMHVQRKLHYYGDIKRAIDAGEDWPDWREYKNRAYSIEC